MATITASTGTIDVNAIVTQLMSLEQKPIKKLDGKISAISEQISAVGKLKSAFGALQDAARKLMNTSTWSAATGSSSDETAVGVTTGAGAPPGTHSVTVARLAQNQTMVSGRIAASSTVVGGGTLHLQMGSVAGGPFTADPGRPAVDIAVPANATLVQVRDAINTADAGVRASLVNDGGQVRLMVRSTDSGLANAFQLTATDDAGSTLSQFASASLTQTTAAQDAEFEIGGLALTASSNHVENVLDGVTLDLKKEGGASTLTVATDKDAIRKTIDAFVAAYNTLNGTLRDLTRYDAATRTAGVMQGNTVIVQAMSRMRDMVTQTVGSGTPSSLSQAGIEIQRDGSLSLDESKFASAAATPAALRALFSSSGTLGAGTGIARRLDTAITQLLGVDGAITGANDTLTRQRARVEDSKDRLESQLTLTEARLRRQYTDLDTKVSSIQSAGNALIAQLSNL